MAVNRDPFASLHIGLITTETDDIESTHTPEGGNRFRPVKKCNDLLALWSDAYILTDDFRVRLDPRRRSGAAPAGDPLVTLDDKFYGLIDDMTARFPHGAPSLVQCRSLTVDGDVYFGAGVVVKGDVTVCNRSDRPLWIEDGALLTGDSPHSALPRN